MLSCYLPFFNPIVTICKTMYVAKAIESLSGVWGLSSMKATKSSQV